jgi:NAD(P)-dependent dehydrogenase (short-subunit alcohol dehydrogenase family)
MDEIREKVQTKEAVALITGSRRGIGLGIALALGNGGFNIVLNGVSPLSETEGVVEQVRSTGCRAEYVQADISIGADREKMIAKIEEVFGRLDILVNNAGVPPLSRLDILEATEESFDHVVNVNLKGAYFLTQRAANWMIEQKKRDKTRTFKIINVSSISAYTPSTTKGDYCVSKAGISMMTALFAIRLAEYDIGVYEIRPSFITTDMAQTMKPVYDKLISEGIMPIRRWGTPEDVGRAVLAIAKGYLSYSTGEVINVDGGFHIKEL